MPKHRIEYHQQIEIKRGNIHRFDSWYQLNQIDGSCFGAHDLSTSAECRSPCMKMIRTGEKIVRRNDELPFIVVGGFGGLTAALAVAWDDGADKPVCFLLPYWSA
jgi:hypothetical protein